MKLLIFSVYDKAVGAYITPFYARAKGEAVRSFTTAVNESSHEFHKHSLDYVLMYLGEYDDGSGTFACVEPQRVIAASECITDPFTPDTEVKGPAGPGPKRVVM